MTKLSDTQTILLSTASQRDNGSLLPLPATLKPSGGTAKAMTALISNGLAEERETSDTAVSRRTEGDFQYGVFITADGEDAIGVEREQGGNCSSSATAATAPSSGPSSDRVEAPSKSAGVIALLVRPDGATLPELIEATGWLPHTTRAALTGIRKKGHAITRGKRDGATCYRIAEVA